MGDNSFDEKLLTEKLSKLNSSQQSIESLSRWCISHRKKAKQIVENWENLFKAAGREQRIALLYLANDILQNSRRKGSEFVNEFWKVLPAALKGVYDGGDESSRKVASRLVDIWEERKVFGSRGQNLKSEVLGKDPSPDKIPSVVSNGKSVNPIKVVKRDSNSLRIKLAVGGLPEKILTAFQLVHEEMDNEEVALDNCRGSVSYVREIEKDIVNVSSQGNMPGSDVMDNLQKQEHMLQQCITQLENSEAIRVALVSQLREALQDQESKLELIRSELLVARGQMEQAVNMRLRLTSPLSAPTNANQQAEATYPHTLAASSTLPPPAPPTLFVNINKDEDKKAAAAAVAAKLAASTSSAQMLTSVLSSLVAEEAASMSSGLKRPRSETPIGFSEVNNNEGTSATYFPATQHGSANFPPVQSTGTHSISQVPSSFLPPPPPPPLAPPGHSSSNQLVQSTMMPLPYGFGVSMPPPLSSNVTMGFARTGLPPAQPQQLQNPQPLTQQQQLQPANGGYYRPHGVGFYGQNHQPSTPPIHRQ